MRPMPLALLAFAGTARAAELTTCGSEPTESCHPTLQEAIDAASPGDTVRISAGTYEEAVEITKDLILLGLDGHQLVGPYEGGVEAIVDVVGPANVQLVHVVAIGATTRALRARDATVLLVGSELGALAPMDRGGVIEAIDSAVAVVADDAEGRHTSIGPGRALTGGLVYLEDSDFLDEAPSIYWGGYASDDGGAIAAAWMDGGPHELTFLGPTLFEQNASRRDGGAIAAPELWAQDVTFQGNRAERNGGAVAASGGDVVLTGVSFEGNEAGYAGGAAYVGGSGSTTLGVSDAVFDGNAAVSSTLLASSGGAVAIASGVHATIAHASFLRNRADAGGALATVVASGADPDVYLLWSALCENEAPYGGGALSFVGGGTVEVLNSWIAFNRAGEEYGYGGAVAVTGSSALRLHHNHVVGNEGLHAGAVWLGWAEGDVEIADNLFAWNEALTSEFVEDAWTIGGEGGHEVHHNLFWADAADGPAPEVYPDPGVVADPLLRAWDDDEACRWTTFLTADARAYVWDGPGRDAGAIGTDPDSSPSDIGAFGGEHAPTSAWYDGDGDGYPAVYDCDDREPAIHPEVEDAPYDGEDRDCDALSDFDADEDGHDAEAHGGDDCDDADPTAFPGAPEIAYDGVDQDCAGGDLDDLDGDGWTPEQGDCVDDDPGVNPGAQDPDPAVDRDCDGIVDVQKPLRPSGCATTGGVSVLGTVLAGLLAITRRSGRGARSTPSATRGRRSAASRRGRGRAPPRSARR